ncbi:MAG: hypothetical protein PF481_05650 [Bacteroidales bacterium]|jgi:hypothetical protein|nr:hypothetical protein [Bacteroidales bacterium]
MKKFYLFIASFFILFSCVEPIDECAYCYSVEEDLETGDITRGNNAKEYCGSEIDDMLAVSDTLAGDYRYYYECD